MVSWFDGTFVLVYDPRIVFQDLPEDKKPQSAELFWLAFRLQARLPLSCRDSCADATIGGLFSEREAGGKGSREMALHVLCSFAEGRFKRAKTRTRKAKVLSVSSCTAGSTLPVRALSSPRQCPTMCHSLIFVVYHT